MDIQKFEEMIIDYLDGNLSGTDKVNFEEALDSSEEFREIFHQYQSIRTVSGSDDDTAPSGEVLERISEHVKQSVKSEKKSFYERFFKFPVLAPTLAVAIIAMLWVSAGEDYLKNKNIIPVSEDSASSEFRSDYKASAGKLTQMENAAEEEELSDKEVDKVVSSGKRDANAPASPTTPAPSAELKKKHEYAAKPAEADSVGNFATARIRQKSENKDLPKKIESDDIAAKKNEAFADLKESTRENVNEEKAGNESQMAALDEGALKSETAKSSTTIGRSMSRTTETTSSVSPSERIEIANSYRNELNEIVTMQYKGDCRQSLSRAQKLLDADPEPSVSIKTDLYVTQGECYMELKQYDKALEVYERAKELTPHRSHLFNGKIKEAYIKQGK